MTKDFSRLSGKIVEKYGTQYNFAIAIGLSERSLSLKLNNRVGWRDEEIERAVQLLGLDINDIPAYFFTKVVQVSWANFVRKENGMSELGLIIVTSVNVVCAVINLFCFIKDRMEWFRFRKIMNLSVGLDLDSMWRFVKVVWQLFEWVWI